MRPQFSIILFLFISCGNRQDKVNVEFNRIIPDTSKTWSGRMTGEAYEQTRSFEKLLKLENLINGSFQDEIRVWYLQNSHDKHVLFIAKTDSLKKWTLRTISFYKNKSDSIYADYSRPLRHSSADSLNFSKLWQMKSQSDLANGDTYGCMDGEDIFIELSNRKKYRFLWYRCPEINKNKDSVFLAAWTLADRLDAFAVEH
jgi:hypothetical protein